MSLLVLIQSLLYDITLFAKHLLEYQEGVLRDLLNMEESKTILDEALKQSDYDKIGTFHFACFLWFFVDFVGVGNQFISGPLKFLMHSIMGLFH